MPGASLLALQVVRHGAPWALQTLQGAFWTAIGDAEKVLDAEKDFDKVWASLRTTTATATASAEDSNQSVAPEGRALSGSGETANVAQSILCPIQ
jgi:hypothetical protein